VAGNFGPERRPAAYGLVAAAGAVAVAVGPLIGGFCTTYFSWRWVFAGEVVIVLVILVLTRRTADATVEERPQLDVVGAVLSALSSSAVSVPASGAGSSRGPTDPRGRAFRRPSGWCWPGSL
jgi:MFS family permease